MNATDIYIANSWAVFVLSASVILHYWRGRPVYDIRRWKPYDFLVAGIIVSFVGKALDCYYWQAAWMAHSRGNNAWLEAGTFWNLWLRQTPILVAATCHIIAAWQAYAAAPGRRVWLTAWSLVLGTCAWLLAYLVA